MQRCGTISTPKYRSKTPIQNRVYSVFATVIRIPDVNFTIEKIYISHILIHLIVHDPLNLIQDLIHHKFWYTCVVYQNMYQNIWYRCNMYQNMYLFLIHIAILWCIIFFDTRNCTWMEISYKNNAQNDTPSDTRNKILIHHSIHHIYI